VYIKTINTLSEPAGLLDIYSLQSTKSCVEESGPTESSDYSNYEIHVRPGTKNRAVIRYD